MLLRRYHTKSDNKTVDKDKISPKKTTNSSNKKKVKGNGGTKKG